MADNAPVNQETIDRIAEAAAAAGPNGISEEEILKASKGGFPKENLAVVVNYLLEQGILQIMKFGDSLSFTLPNEESNKLRGLTPEDRLIYQMIKRSSTTGIWLRHLKTKSNIAASKVMRILGVLERRKLVKAVKTAEGGKKRVYMLFDLNPPAKLDYNPEKMSKLTSLTLEYLVKKTWASVDDITSALQATEPITDETGSGHVELTTTVVQNIVDTLVYDTRVEEFKNPQERGRRGGAMCYKPSQFRVDIPWSTRDRLPLTALTETPCGCCPVFDKCSDEGDVTPTNCPYLKKWLTW